MKMTFWCGKKCLWLTLSCVINRWCKKFPILRRHLKKKEREKRKKKDGRSDVRSSTFLNIHVQTEITFLPHVCSCSINSARLLVGQMVGESRLSIIYASFVKHFSIDLSLFGFQLFSTNFDQDGKTFWNELKPNQWIKKYISFCTLTYVFVWYFRNMTNLNRGKKGDST